ncbi:unnamed protein product, partial [Soboliphyme baturini]|uniref:Dystonin n=1 Tax=Soboliphyme baturini TaxID=241478 RepID=A0A183IX67_9BILA
VEEIRQRIAETDETSEGCQDLIDRASHFFRSIEYECDKQPPGGMPTTDDGNVQKLIEQVESWLAKLTENDRDVPARGTTTEDGNDDDIRSRFNTCQAAGRIVLEKLKATLSTAAEISNELNTARSKGGNGRTTSSDNGNGNNFVSESSVSAAVGVSPNEKTGHEKPSTFETSVSRVQQKECAGDMSMSSHLERTSDAESLVISWTRKRMETDMCPDGDTQSLRQMFEGIHAVLTSLAAENKLRTYSVSQFTEKVKRCSRMFEEVTPKYDQVIRSGQKLADHGPPELETQKVLDDIDMVTTEYNALKHTLDLENQVATLLADKYSRILQDVGVCSSQLQRIDMQSKEDLQQLLLKYEAFISDLKSTNSAVKDLCEDSDIFVPDISAEEAFKIIYVKRDDLMLRLKAIDCSPDKTVNVLLTDCSSLNKALTSAVMKLCRQMGKTGEDSLPFLDRQTALKETEDVFAQVDDSIESLKTLAEQLADVLPPANKVTLFEKMAHCEKHFEKLKLDAAGKRIQVESRLAVHMDIKDKTDELVFWVDETEALLSSHADPFDCRALHSFMDRCEAKMEEVKAKQRQLQEISTSAEELLKGETVFDPAKRSFNHNLADLTDRLQTIANETESKLSQYHEKISRCVAFSQDVNDAMSWVLHVKNMMLEFKSAKIYTPTRFNLKVINLE